MISVESFCQPSLIEYSEGERFVIFYEKYFFCWYYGIRAPRLYDIKWREQILFWGASVYRLPFVWDAIKYQHLWRLCGVKWKILMRSASFDSQLLVSSTHLDARCATNTIDSFYNHENNPMFTRVNGHISGNIPMFPRF